MLFEIEKAFVFQTTFRHRGGSSATTTRTSTLFLFYHGNEIELIVVLYRSCDVILKQAVPCCTLLIVGMQTIGFRIDASVCFTYHKIISN